MDYKVYNKLVEDGQDIHDLALQEYGDIKLLPVLLFDTGYDPMVNVIAGQSLPFRETVPVDIEHEAEQLQYFRRKELRVNCQNRK